MTKEEAFPERKSLSVCCGWRHMALDREIPLSPPEKVCEELALGQISIIISSSLLVPQTTVDEDDGWRMRREEMEMTGGTHSQPDGKSDVRSLVESDSFARLEIPSCRLLGRREKMEKKKTFSGSMDWNRSTNSPRDFGIET